MARTTASWALLCLVGLALASRAAAKPICGSDPESSPTCDAFCDECIAFCGLVNDDAAPNKVFSLACAEDTAGKLTYKCFCPAVLPKEVTPEFTFEEAKKDPAYNLNATNGARGAGALLAPLAAAAAAALLL